MQSPYQRRIGLRRRGAALMLAIFVAAVASMTVVAVLDTQTLQYASLKSTVDYDRARYLAEAGVAHAMAVLEVDFDNQAIRTQGLGPVNFPPGSNDTYSVQVDDGANGIVVITASGTAGSFTRRLQITAKMGG